jgi:hypothetical protein
MKSNNSRILRCALAVFFIAALGCAAKQTFLIPPKVDLNAYQTIGVIEFSSNARGNLQQFASQQFLHTIQSSQPGIRILELGHKEQVLRSVQHAELDLEAIKSLGEKYHVDALFTGHVDVSDVKPNIQLTSLLTSLHVQADVKASLTAKLYETRLGATLWTDSARTSQTVGHVGIYPDRPVEFGARNPEDAYGQLVDTLVYRIARDFRVRYERR